MLFVQKHFEDYPDGPLRLIDLKDALAITDASNFRKTIRQNDVFIRGLEALGVEEVTIGNQRYSNALARKHVRFPPLKGPCYIADV